MLHPLLAVIPARAGSKGVPGKNTRQVGGLPLIAHSILFAAACPEIDYCVVSTDSEEIAAVAGAHGGQVPFIRPPELAQDETPMWPVLQHALREVENQQGRRFESVLLLQPTAPCRLPEDVSRAVQVLENDPAAVGVVAVSEPPFNPRWVCVEREEPTGFMRLLVPSSAVPTRRQDVSSTYRINGMLYLWRRDYLADNPVLRICDAPHRMLIVPEERALDVDSTADLTMLELLLREKVVQFPWEAGIIV